MQLDDLKLAWAEEVKILDNKPEISSAIDALEEETVKLDRDIKRRDVMESLIALCLVPFWIYRMFSYNSMIELTGLIILTLACLFIPYRLRKARHTLPNKLSSIKAFLTLEKQKIQSQMTLLGSVLSWYLAPLYIGIVLVSVGDRVDEAGAVVITEMLTYYLIFVTIFFGLIWWANIHAVKKKFKPILDRIEKRLAELEQS